MKKHHQHKYARLFLVICTFILLLISFGSLPAVGQSPAPMAATIYVDIDATGANDGSSWEDAFTDLQPALEAAVADDQIWVAAGTYLPTEEQCGVGDRYKTFQLKNGVEVYGGFDPSTGDVGWDDRDWEANPVILSGDIGIQGDPSDNSYHVFCHPGGLNLDSSAILNGFTISDGSGWSVLGAGMYNFYSSPTLINVVFYNNNTFGWSPSKGGGMYNDNSSPSLTNVQFSENSATNSGGGMYNSFSSPVMTNVTFTNNSAETCAGMSNLTSSPMLNTVTFSYNSTDSRSSGGGLCNFDGSDATLTNVTFSYNSASGAGGMNNVFSSPTLINVIFNGNSATNEGGGMYNYNSSPTLTNVIFTNNSAGEAGAGMFNESSSPILNRVTFFNNTAAPNGSGGGIYNNNDSNPTLTNVTLSTNTAYIGGGMTNSDSSPILINVTFTGNIANITSGAGGGIMNFYSLPDLTNAILWGDTPDEIYNFDSNPVVTYSDVQGGYEGEGNIDADPLLGPLQDNGGFVFTHALGVGSPAIDAGNPDPASCPETDARGIPRPQDGDGDGTAVCDMGAYEFLSDRLATFTMITSDLPDPSLPGQPFTVTLEVTGTIGIPTGVVTVTVSEAADSCIADLVDGTGACSLALSEQGEYTLVAEYNGDDFYLPSSDIDEHVVRLVESTTQITGDAPDPTLPGQPFTVTVVVTSTFGIPTGVVSVTVSEAGESCSADLLDGVGACSLDLSDPGNYTLIAEYGGDDSYLPSISPGELHEVESIRAYLAIIIR